MSKSRDGQMLNAMNFMQRATDKARSQGDIRILDGCRVAFDLRDDTC
jgi:hypothetical protein